MKFFKFSWNDAQESDWYYIERNFIAAYVNAYKDTLIYQNISHLAQAEEIWASAYTQATQGNFKVFDQAIFQPLAPLLSHIYNTATPGKEALATDRNILVSHFELQKNTDVTVIKENLIKLTALRLHFAELYKMEKDTLIKQGNPPHIHYLIARYQDQPVAFFSCQLNYQSGRIYLRWVTMSPTFQRLGLGKRMLEELNRRFPENIGMELYTRVANSARDFYRKMGFIETNQYDFSEPSLSDPLSKQPGYFAKFVRKWLSAEADRTCFGPTDEAITETNDFIGYAKRRSR